MTNAQSNTTYVFLWLCVSDQPKHIATEKI